MSEVWHNENLIYLGVLLCISFLAVQVIILLRMRNLLQAVSQNFESVMYYLRKFLQQPQSAPTIAVPPKTCNFGGSLARSDENGPHQTTKHKTRSLGCLCTFPKTICKIVPSAQNPQQTAFETL